MLKTSASVHKFTAQLENEDKEYLTEVYCWGSDKFGQMGLAGSQYGLSYVSPRFCTFNVVISQIACGEEHAAFIANGYLYTMGSNAEGRLGISKRDTKGSSSPCLVNFLSRFDIVQVSCGAAHTACVAATGEAFTWGRGSDGQLGLGSLIAQISPQLVQLPSDSYSNPDHIAAISVSCGSNFTGLLTKNGDVFMFGNGVEGQLGNGKKENESTPHKVRTLEEKIAMISCGYQHTLFLTSHGKVYACGLNKAGQLGTGNRKSYLYPQKIIALETLRITKISANHHSAALTFKGALYIWGSTPLGENLIPIQIAKNLETVFMDVGLGENFTTLLDLRGYVYSFGQNDSGELGQGDTQKRLQLTKITQLKNKKVMAIACGKNFVIALGRTVRKADFFREIDQSTYDSNSSKLEGGIAYTESSITGAQGSRLDLTPPKRSKLKPENTSPLETRDSLFDREIRARMSTGSQRKSPELRSYWTDGNSGKKEPPKEMLSQIDGENLYSTREEVKKLRAQIEYLEGQVEQKTRQNLFYENKIEELKKFAIENEQKDQKMHELLDSIEVEHQRYRRELINMEQDVAEKKDALKQKDQTIENLKAKVQRLAEEKVNLIDLSKSFEYLRDLENERTAATSRQGSKEESFRSSYGSQKKRTPENLNEMVKFYETRISRLKEMINWTNDSFNESGESQFDYSTQKITSRGLEGYLIYKRDLGQEKASELRDRTNESLGERGYYSVSAIMKETQKVQPVPSTSQITTKITTEPPPVKPKGSLKKSPITKKNQPPLIKKDMASSSSVLKTKSSDEKPALKPQQQRHHHTKSYDSQAFYSSVKGVLKDFDTPEYSTEIVSQVHDKSQESSDQT